jgi:glyoxylase-like metal-dependent hydrolase (beta-lactamase superfamily II)
MTTTSTLAVHGSSALLVDPAWDPDELELLAAGIAARDLRVTAGLSTHPHHDHLLWHPAYGDVPRWAAPRAVAVVAAGRDRLLAELGPGYPEPVLATFGRVRALPGAVVPEPFGDDGGDPWQVVVHDGHAPGHLALWAPDRGVLVAGDMLSDVELPLPFDPDDLDAYLAGLDALAPYVARAGVLVPGHGTPTTRPAERLDADRRYLDAVLAGRDPDDPRRANPGMAAEHDHLVRLVRAQSSGGLRRHASAGGPGRLTPASPPGPAG